MSAYCTVNGKAAIRGTVTRPRVGAWHADLVVDSADASLFSGAVEIAIGDSLRLQGTSFRSGVHHETVFLRAIAGAGGLGTVLPPKSYQGVPARIPITDALQGAGEALSLTADSGLLGRLLRQWARVQQPAGFAFTSLLRAISAPGWRILDDGSIWIGSESWADATPAQFDEIEVEPHTGVTMIGTDTPAMYPGSSFNGKRVSTVEHRISAGEVRHLLWFEASA